MKSMLPIPLKITMVHNMPVPHADTPGFHVDLAAIQGNNSGKSLFRNDFPRLTKDEFLQKGLDELRKGEEQAFVAVYTDTSQSDISSLVFKSSLDTIYQKPDSSTGQQVYVLDKDLIPNGALCDQGCEEPIRLEEIHSWMSKDDAKQVLDKANRQFFNSFGVDFDLADDDITTAYLRDINVPETLTFLGEVKRPVSNDQAALVQDKIERRVNYNNIIDNLYLDQNFSEQLAADENSVNLYFLAFTGNTRQGNAGVGKDDIPVSHKVVIGQWTNKSDNKGNTLLRQRKVYVEEGTPSLVFTFSHELGHILGESHTETDDFMASPKSLLVANDAQIKGMRNIAKELRTSFGLPEEPLLNTITGTNKKDKLVGTSDSDIIMGSDGKDKLKGFEGHDVLSGGRGRDKLTGGPGRDIFVVSEGKDIVTDFSSSDHDKILVDKIYNNPDLKISSNGQYVRLKTDIGVFKIKNASMEAVEAAIVVDETL